MRAGECVGGGFGQLSGKEGVVGVDGHVRIEYLLEGDGEKWSQWGFFFPFFCWWLGLGLMWCRNVTNAQTRDVLSMFEHKSGPYMTGYVFIFFFIIVLY